MTHPHEPTTEQLRLLLELVDRTAPEEIDCEAFLDRVAAYLEAGGDRAAPELSRVAQHMAVCPPCLEEYEALVAAIGE